MKKPAPKEPAFMPYGNDQYFVELLEDDGEDVLLLDDDGEELLLLDD